MASMQFHYYMPSRILFGAGALNRLGQQRLPGKKALVVISAGKSMRENGYLTRVVQQLERGGAQAVVFDRILANPILAHVMQGAELARSQGCDFVVGLGGGSSIDSAKAIAVMAANPGNYWDYISGGSGKGKAVDHSPLPIVAITTTAGTGTEADPFTVITKEDTNEKIGFGIDGTFPVLSVVDPELMTTVPPQLTAYQGFDALFHATEGYLNRTANAMSDLYARKAIALLGAYLPIAVADGDNLEAREQVALANTLAGMVETTSGCISEHSLEHALSAYHPNLPHGAGLIAISAAYYTHIAASGSSDARMVDMARALGAAQAQEPMDFVRALVKLEQACGVDQIRLSDYGLTIDQIDRYAQNARDTMGGLFEVDPCEISLEDCKKILADSFR
jgi:alcohol dehydrogenase